MLEVHGSYWSITVNDDGELFMFANHSQWFLVDVVDIGKRLLIFVKHDEFRLIADNDR